MADFVYKKKSELKQLPIEEVKKYYRDLREYEYNNNIPFKHVLFKDLVNPLLRLGLKFLRKVDGRKLEVIGDYRIKSSRPHIYACTHVGRYDTEICLEAMKDHAYLFYGDREETYLNFDGRLIELNGAVCLDTGYITLPDKTVVFDEDCINDRKIALKRMIQLIKQGQNAYVNPEGAWNITPNNMVQPLYPGIIDMNFETDADIIPIGVERIGDKFVVLIGRNIDFKKMTTLDLAKGYMEDVFGITNENRVLPNYCNNLGSILNRKEMLNYLRDALATLKWEILEREGQQSRADIPDNYEDEYVNSIMCESEHYYTADIIRHTRFRDKKNPSPDEVFGPIRKLSKWNNLPKRG